MGDRQPLISPYLSRNPYPHRHTHDDEACPHGGEDDAHTSATCPVDCNRVIRLQVGNVLAFLGTFTIQCLNYAGVFGKSEGDIRSRYDHILGIPAEYAFYAWGFVYAMGAGFCIYQALPSSRGNEVIFRDVGGRWIFAHYFLAAWAILFCLDEQVGCVLVLAILVCFMSQIYRRVGVGVYVEQNTLSDFWLVEVPTSAYLAWSSVLLALNVAIALDAHGWEGQPWTISGWTALVISLLSVASLGLLYRRVDVVFSLVMAWMFVGVAIAQDRHMDDDSDSEKGMAGVNGHDDDDIIRREGTMLFRLSITWASIVVFFTLVAGGLRLYDWHLRRQDPVIPRNAKIRV